MVEGNKVILVWSFSPPGFIDGDIDFYSDAIYEVVIEDGKIEIHMGLDMFDSNPDLISELHRLLELRFRIRLLERHEEYQLSDLPTIRKVYADGRKDGIIVLATAKASGVGTAVILDCIIKDKDGKIIRSSHQERIEEEAMLFELATKKIKQDTTMSALLESYESAVKNSEHELVHLYEIIDILRKKFDNENEAREKLGLSNTDWKTLCRIANNAPLNQGRHRGCHVGNLRDAEYHERNKARSIARKFIVAYITYCEKT